MFNVTDAAGQPKVVSDVIPYCSVQLLTSVYAKCCKHNCRPRKVENEDDGGGGWTVVARKPKGRGRVPISSPKNYLAEGTLGHC